MSLKVVKLSKRYGDRWALSDVSIEAAAGEVFGIFGPSGSGKSTLLNTIHGVTEPDCGSVYFNDKDVSKLDAEAREFTTVQNARRSIWQRISKTKSFSSRGERESQNVLNAIDSARNAILLDDTFCTMDPRRSEDFIASIRSVAKQRNLPVIFASGNFQQILLACDRVAVLVTGEVKQIGVPQEIYEKPESRVVADVTGRNNLFAARRLTSSKADIPEFQTIDGGHRLFGRRIERGALGALNQNVTLAIRPEQISISFGASFPEDNLLKATVMRVQFLGPTTLIELDADGLKLQVLVLRLVGLNIGEECMVGLPPDRIQIFKD
ncbi:MAG: ABC transporter ATP-binding protein [Pyrinomonadaceae bacterium]